MCLFWVFFFFKQKTAYELRISDWSSDVCSSDLGVMSGRHRRVIGDASAGRPRDEVIGALSLKGIKSGIELRQDHEPDGVGLWRADQIGRASCRERVCQYV